MIDRDDDDDDEFTDDDNAFVGSFLMQSRPYVSVYMCLLVRSMCCASVLQHGGLVLARARPLNKYSPNQTAETETPGGANIDRSARL